MIRRRAATKIIFGKTKITIKKRGRVVYSVRTHDELDAFLRGYDPDLQARRDRALSGEAEAAIQRILAA